MDVLSLFSQEIRDRITSGEDLQSIECFVSDTIDLITEIKKERIFGH